MVVSGEDPDNGRFQLRGHPRQSGDVIDLHLAVRNVPVLEVRGKVVVACHDAAPQAARSQISVQLAAGLKIVVEHGKVRPFGHQHHRREFELMRLIEKLQ